MKRSKIRRLHEDPNFLDLNAEKANATKKTRRENLNMNVIELDGRTKPDFLRKALKILLEGGDHIDREPEKMLTVAVAPNLAVSFRVTIPASESQTLVTFLKELQPGYEPTIHV